ncbi:bifunctional 2-polyprenyl-6-hydroxyphenol methylase/3-demethylubiquinol 3-O-methyltransferase UbiG [Chitinophaga sp. Cy-1792]|uniref:class I SAM-dependent methyltransferase n=1 Tax=Chitinophaga sp. Cy-1792 TaxID=2608339 RepID=UPI00141E04F8|nr:class I SAM-dependent methyltransferase [Chitinophaga sp. Cy-1792]NIG54830.1 methyltransferase domain-containing protein [Chitinophaga sp. Cy-1792]
MSPNITYEYERITDIKRLNFITNSLQQVIPAHANILDVGCGNGVITRHLGQFGYHVLGIDVSEKTIAVARSKNTLSNVRFEVISAEALVASGAQYDAVICSEVLEHLHDPGVLLKTIYQSLKDNGTLIVTVPNGMGPREVLVTKPMLKVRRSPRLQSFVNRIKSALGYKGTTVQSQADNLDHVQFFTRAALRELAAANNFDIINISRTNFVEDVFPFSMLTKRVKALQSLDCQVAEVLPLGLTGGFNTIWKKK